MSPSTLYYNVPEQSLSICDVVSSNILSQLETLTASKKSGSFLYSSFTDAGKGEGDPKGIYLIEPKGQEKMNKRSLVDTFQRLIFKSHWMRPF